MAALAILAPGSGDGGGGGGGGSFGAAPATKDEKPRLPAFSDADSSFCVRETTNVSVHSEHGNTFVNQYIVIKNLGQGSYGRVKLCLNTHDNKLYAVKVVDRRLLRKRAIGSRKKNSNLMDEIMREVAIMKKLSHPNVVGLYEVIDAPAGKYMFLVLEYMESGPIQGSEEFAKIPEAVARRYFREICKGLDFLHFNKVIHRDLKPENLLKSVDGSVKIADFGVSVLFDASDTIRKTAGTPAYLAPEVVSGGEFHGRAADVWALGVCLYVFVYGQLPFMAGTAILLYEAIKTQALQFPKGPPQVSAELRDLLTLVLVKDPEKRLTLAEIMAHPWVTEGGTLPPLLPIGSTEGAEQVQVTDQEVKMAVKRKDMMAMLKPVLKEQVFASGEYLMRQGEVGTSMFFINAGECDVLIESEPGEKDNVDEEEEEEDLEEAYLGGKDPHDSLDYVPAEAGPAAAAAVGETLVATRGRGELIGEMAVLSDSKSSSRRMASVRARTEVRALVVTKEEFKRILAEQPEAEEEIRRTIDRRKSETIINQVQQRLHNSKAGSSPPKPAS